MIEFSNAVNGTDVAEERGKGELQVEYTLVVVCGGSRSRRSSIQLGV